MAKKATRKRHSPSRSGLSQDKNLLGVPQDELISLFELMKVHGVAELEIQTERARVEVKLGEASHAGHRSLVYPSREAPPTAIPARPVKQIKSPFVGTFYQSPSPSAPRFVELGSQIRKGQKLCIIEAMKLMNEIVADQEGTVTKICVENGSPVEFGQPLFELE